jgi:hypothetical protein
MSGVAMQTEFMMLGAKLSEKADSMELAEEGVWRLICEYSNMPYDVYVEYPHQYNIRDNAADLDFLIKARASGVNNSAFQNEINRQIIELVVDDADTLSEIMENENGFEPHVMTNPQTGEQVTVTSKSQHLDLVARGFTHG